MNTVDIDSIVKILFPLRGLQAWNVKLGIGSFITIEFGNKILSTRGKSYGEWYLWIYSCGWFLEDPTGPYLGSEDPRETLKKGITILEGHIIENTTISPIGFQTNFIFDTGLVLHTFPLSFVDPAPYWKFFTPEGKVLIIGPFKQWTYESSSQSVSSS